MSQHKPTCPTQPLCTHAQPKPTNFNSQCDISNLPLNSPDPIPYSKHARLDHGIRRDATKVHTLCFKHASLQNPWIGHAAPARFLQQISQQFTRARSASHCRANMHAGSRQVRHAYCNCPYFPCFEGTTTANITLDSAIMDAYVNMIELGNVPSIPKA